MIRKAIYWKKICKLHFQAHAQVHEYRNVTNTLEKEHKK